MTFTVPNTSALGGKCPFFPQSAANQLCKPASTTPQTGFQTATTTANQLFKPASTTSQFGFQTATTTANQLFKPDSTTQTGFQPTPTTTNQLYKPVSTTHNPWFQSTPSSQHINDGFTQSDLDHYLETASGAVVDIDTNYIAQKERQFVLLSPNINRDIYNIIYHPYNLNLKIKSDLENRAVLLARKPIDADNSQISKFVFIDNQLLKGLTLPSEWSILSDELTINAIDSIGVVNALPLAIFKSFEEYIKFKVKKWTNADIDKLSIEFLICFGKELYPRIDLNNRIRSRELTLDEQKILSKEPYIQYINPSIIKKYQLLKTH